MSYVSTSGDAVFGKMAEPFFAEFVLRVKKSLFTRFGRDPEVAADNKHPYPYTPKYLAETLSRFFAYETWIHLAWALENVPAQAYSPTRIKRLQSELAAVSATAGRAAPQAIAQKPIGIDLDGTAREFFETQVVDAEEISAINIRWYLTRAAMTVDALLTPSATKTFWDLLQALVIELDVLRGAPSPSALFTEALVEAVTDLVPPLPRMPELIPWWLKVATLGYIGLEILKILQPKGKRR